MIINKATLDFIRQHRNENVRQLALKGAKEQTVDLMMALQQIAGWQTANRKLPSWAAVDGIVYPPHLNMEQCSSEQTARYKAGVVQRLVDSETCDKGCFVDLTGGFGVDFYWMSQGFRQCVFVEQNSELCAISSGNFRLLHLETTVFCGSAADFLSTLDHAAVVYLDPSRRNEHGGRTYGIEDCTPNVLELLPQLAEKSHFIVIKLSPMLDWRKAVADIEETSKQRKFYVSEVHIVSVDNECKELLLVLEQAERPIRLVCVNNDQVFEVPKLRLLATAHSALMSTAISQSPNAPNYLYEPNASIMKAGCFKEVECRFSVRQISDNSHLFLVADEIDDFPGRRFRILSISSMCKQDLRTSLKDIRQANVTVRNFPLTVDQLRKKLKIKDGGDHYIFATTMADGQHKLLICRKIG